MSHLSASEIVDNANDHLCHVTDISENTDSGDVVRYFSEKNLIGIPTRNEIAAENDTEELTAILKGALTECQEIPFMAVDVEESTKFFNGQIWYSL